MHNVVERSSVEAEFRAMTLGICELLCLKIVLEDLKNKWGEKMKLYCNCRSAINIALNLVERHRTKHIALNLYMHSHYNFEI